MDRTELIKKLMREQGRKTAWMAKQCGVEATTMKKYLAGRQPSRSVLILMAHAFGVPVELLLQGDVVEPTEDLEPTG